MADTNAVSESPKKPLILIVDDEEAICSTLSDVLQDEAYPTVCAHSGPEAVAKLVEFAPALVFLDIWMPGWDGIETLGKIKALSPSTEVVVISGHASIANALEATKRGAFDFIEKPLDLESIIIAASRALEHRESLLGPGAKSAGVNSAAVQDDPDSIRMDALMLHPGLLSNGLKGENRGQRTLKQSAVLYGQGLHSGAKSGLVLEPLPKDSGIHFVELGATKSIPAFVDYVESTSFCTTIRKNGASAATIEHLMASLHAYGISNVLIKCNSEVPILDGSATDFCAVIEEVGIEEQGGDWFELAVDRKITITESGADHAEVESLCIEPGNAFEISYELSYPEPIGRQEYSFVLKDGESFKQNIAPARTFGFMRDIEKLQKAGLAAGGRLDNFVLIGEEEIVNTELRFPEEPCRHKILDIIGDLFLLGRPIRGKVTAKMSGHSDNLALLRELRALAVD